MSFSIIGAKPGKPLALHDEPIYCDGKIIGITTSGNFSYNFNKSLIFAYVKTDHIDNIKKKPIEIEIEKVKYQILIEKKSLFDFNNEYLKS